MLWEQQIDGVTTLTLGSQPRQKLATKIKVWKGEGRECNLGITFTLPKSVRECEGMNPHTRKWAPTLGIGVLMDF
jgi:hypothetical protein